MCVKKIKSTTKCKSCFKKSENIEKWGEYKKYVFENKKQF